MSDGNWYSPVAGQYVIKSYWLGWKAAIKSHYPCKSLRLVDVETEEIIEEVHGNGVVGI